MGLTQISTDGVKNDAVTAGKIPANAVGSSEIAANAVGSSELADNAVDTAAIADQAVTLDKLPHGDSNNNGKFLRANNGADPTFESIPAGTTINNNADNRVITGSGTANTLNGESGLTYNGSSALIVSGSGQQDILIGSTNAGGASIAFDGDSNGDGAGSDYALIRHNTDGNLEITTRNPSGATATIFKQGTTESLRIDDHGVLRVGNTHDQSTSGNTKRIALGAKGSIWGWATGQVNGALTLADNYYWDGVNNKAIESDYSAYLSLRSGSLRFGCTAASQTGGNNISGGIHEKVRFANDGHVEIADGNLVVASGHGIDFSATGHTSGNTSELFDDYEEGTFTPTWVMTNGDQSVTYHNQEGSYVKIGSLVQFQVYIRVNTVNNNGSGILYMAGLPFNASSGAHGYGVPAFGYGDGIQNMNSRSNPVGYIEKTNARLYMYVGLDSSGNQQNMTIANNITNNTQMRFCGTYQT